MADERGLDGLDPYDLQDIEAARIAAWIEQSGAEAMGLPSGCQGWSRRDVLAHLLATEDYHRACLDGTARDLIAQLLSAGPSSLDEVNAAGVALHAGRSVEELLAAWRERNAESRAGFRAADGTDIDSSVGTYPGRFQAFHVAHELALHADDMAVPVQGDETDERLRWMAGVSRFALTEVKAEVSVETDGDSYVVRRGDLERSFDGASFVAGVSGRAAAGALSEADADLLSLGY